MTTVHVLGFFLSGSFSNFAHVSKQVPGCFEEVVNAVRDFQTVSAGTHLGELCEPTGEAKRRHIYRRHKLEIALWYSDMSVSFHHCCIFVCALLTESENILIGSCTSLGGGDNGWRSRQLDKIDLPKLEDGLKLIGEAKSWGSHSQQASSETLILALPEDDKLRVYNRYCEPGQDPSR